MKYHKKNKFKDLLEIVKILRSPNGCPWDKEQTPLSMREHLLEETYEVIQAIQNDNAENIKEELGDLLLIICMITQMYFESHTFNIQEVIDGITDKLIRRHPHVFGDISIKSSKEVLNNWNKIKSNEKPFESVLDSINLSAPSLEHAKKLQLKAAEHGFDWEKIDDVKLKINEEINELEQSVSNIKKEEEFGDLLFSLVNFARHLNINPEIALKNTCNKFMKRFRYVEAQMNKFNQDLSKNNLEKMDSLWDEAKKLESVDSVHVDGEQNTDGNAGSPKR